MFPLGLRAKASEPLKLEEMKVWHRMSVWVLLTGVQCPIRYMDEQKKLCLHFFPDDNKSSQEQIFLDKIQFYSCNIWFFPNILKHYINENRPYLYLGEI